MESPGTPTGIGGPDVLVGIDALLDRWQNHGDVAALEKLVDVLRPPLQLVVARALGRHGIRDPGARDEAMMLVFEQLCRLGLDVASPVARFDQRRNGKTLPAGAVSAGWAFVRCIAESRAHDMARAARRRDHRAAEYAALHAAPPDPTDDGRRCDAAERLRAAIETLDERSRTVVALLLEGRTQAVIAHVLGVCEGTVSRIRARAIARLRVLMSAQPGGRKPEEP